VLDGNLALLPDGAFRGATMALHAAWHQVPAASLPDDDATLAHLLRYGRDVAGWQSARAAGALAEWIKCSDGRLYHPALAAQANEAWQQRKFHQERAARGAAARWGKAAPADADGAAASDARPAKVDDASSMLQASFKDAKRDEREKRREEKGGREDSPPDGRGARARADAGADPEGFAEWWAEYPRKDAKGAARKAYAAALKRAAPAELLVALRRYPFDHKDGGQFIPYPATWLNQGRYESAHEAPAPAPDASKGGKWANLKAHVLGDTSGVAPFPARAGRTSWAVDAMRRSKLQALIEDHWGDDPPSPAGTIDGTATPADDAPS
jgi:hypothetical protein